MIVQSIVEGHGDVEAVPLLLRRICQEVLGCYQVKVSPAMKVSRGRISKESYVSPLLRIACGSTGCTLVLLIFDADEDCPEELNAAFKEWASRRAITAESELIAIPREYEAWFLAALDSLAGKRGLPITATALENAEEIRGAKERLSGLMPRGAPYVETSDQPALTAILDLNQVSRRCASFRRLVRKLEEHHARCNCVH